MRHPADHGCSGTRAGTKDIDRLGHSGKHGYVGETTKPAGTMTEPPASEVAMPADDR